MPARYEQLAGWINENGWTSGAELGVFSGRTHFYLLDHCPMLADLIGVDVWDLLGFAEGATKSGEKCRCQYCNETRADRNARTIAQMREDVIAKSETMAPRSQILIELTTQASRHVDDFSLDFVFVDGDHSTEGVAGDIIAWQPKIRVGGWLIGHDHNMKSVRDGIQIAMGKPSIEQHDDHIWVIRC